MLCCVSRKAAAGTDGDLPRFGEDEALRKLDEAVLDVAAVAGSFASGFRGLEALPEETSELYRGGRPRTAIPLTAGERPSTGVRSAAFPKLKCQLLTVLVPSAPH
jgi:hypothetical protein